jgi:fucose permease
MKENKLNFYSACLGMLLFGIVMITLGSVLPAISEKFSLNKIEAGSLVSLLPLGILTGSLLFGPVVDRYGYKLLMIVCAFLVLIVLEGIAYAESIFALRASVFVIGFGGGVLNGATNALVADISDVTKGANLSLLGIFYGIGALGMPTILNVLKNAFSVKEIISSVGVFIFLIGVLFIFVPFPRPKQARGFPVRAGIRMLKSPALLVAGFFLFFASGSEGLVNNWITTYLENVLSVDNSKGLLALSALMAALTVSRLALGKMLKVLSSKTVLIIFVFFELAASVILYFASGYYYFMTGIVLLGVGMAACFPVMLGYVAELFSDLSGTAFSVVLVMALTGNMVVSYSMGIIGHLKGIETWPGILILCVAAMIALLRAFLFLTSGKLKFKP